MSTKKPRLFYRDDNLEIWVHFEPNELYSIIDVLDLKNGQSASIEIKRHDMTDEEVEGMKDA